VSDKNLPAEVPPGLLKVPIAEIRKDTKEKATRFKDAWAGLAKNLYRICVAQDYKKWDYNTFEQYIENELGLEPRSVYHWLAIYKKLVLGLGVQEEKLTGRAWGKVRYIVSIATQKNVDSWLEKCDHLSQDAIIEAIRNAKSGKAVGEGPVLVPFPCKGKVTEDEKATILLAVDQAKRIIQHNQSNKSDRDGHAEEMIHLHFLSDHFDAAKDVYAKIVARIERLFNVKILTFDKNRPDWKECFEKARDAIRSEVKV
jgi:hypothetical protein